MPGGLHLESHRSEYPDERRIDLHLYVADSEQDYYICSILVNGTLHLYNGISALNTGLRVNSKGFPDIVAFRQTKIDV